MEPAPNVSAQLLSHHMGGGVGGGEGFCASTPAGRSATAQSTEKSSSDLWLWPAVLAAAEHGRLDWLAAGKSRGLPGGGSSRDFRDSRSLIGRPLNLALEGARFS